MTCSAIWTPNTVSEERLLNHVSGWGKDSSGFRCGCIQGSENVAGSSPFYPYTWASFSRSSSSDSFRVVFSELSSFRERRERGNFPFSAVGTGALGSGLRPWLRPRTQSSAGPPPRGHQGLGLVLRGRRALRPLESRGGCGRADSPGQAWCRGRKRRRRRAGRRTQVSPQSLLSTLTAPPLRFHVSWRVSEEAAPPEPGSLASPSPLL